MRAPPHRAFSAREAARRARTAARQRGIRPACAFARRRGRAAEAARMGHATRPARGESPVTMRLMTARAALAWLLLSIAACASPGPPPGGPEDPDPPELVAITPDTMATGASPRAVVFRFNEVVSERPQGATTLGGLFLISP